MSLQPLLLPEPPQLVVHLVSSILLVNHLHTLQQLSLHTQTLRRNLAAQRHLCPQRRPPRGHTRRTLRIILRQVAHTRRMHTSKGTRLRNTPPHHTRMPAPRLLVLPHRVRRNHIQVMVSNRPLNSRK